MLTHFCFLPQIDSVCNLALCVVCILTDVILTLCSCPCTLDLIMIYTSLHLPRRDDYSKTICSFTLASLSLSTERCPFLWARLNASILVGARYFFASSTARKNESWAQTVRRFTRGIHVLTKSCIACKLRRCACKLLPWSDWLIPYTVECFWSSLIRRSFQSFISIRFRVS